MAISIAAGASRVGALLSQKGSSFRKGVGNLVSASNETFKRTRDKIKITDKKIEVQKIKQKDEDKNFNEKLQRMEKEGLVEVKKKKLTMGGFLKDLPGKINKSFWLLVAAWAFDNLPKIEKFITNTIKKIQVFAASLKRVLTTTFTVGKSAMKILGALLQNLSEFDFADSKGRLERAQEDFEIEVDNLAASADELKNVWSREEAELTSILTDLDSGKSMREAINNANAIEPKTPAFGPGSTAKGTEASELARSTKLLAGYEGFESEAYPDPYTGGAPWTIGFGSTRINGRPVRPGDKVTREEALEMKKADVQSHRAVAIDQVGGIDEWMKLPENTRVALNSIAYNYGSIPNRIMSAVRTGDSRKIAEAIRGLSGDNDSINAWRRLDEAQVITTGRSSRADIGAPAPQTSTSQAPQTAKEGGGSYELTDKVPFDQLSKTARQGGTGAVGKTSDYGLRKSPGGIGSTNHKGVDIGTSGQGNWFCAIKVNGKVTFAGTMSGYGKIVIIKSGQYEYRFAHLRNMMVKRGDSYNSGTPIGEIGNTGHSTGTHLHFEVLVQGAHTDPNPYLNLLEVGRLKKKVKAQNAQINGTSKETAAQVSEKVSSIRTTTNRRGRTIVVRQTQILKTN